MLILWLSLENTALITRASKRCTPAGCTPSAHSSSCPNVCMAPFSSSSASQFPPEWGWLHLKMMWKRNIPSAVGCLPHSEWICLPSPWATTKVALKASHSEPDKMAKFFLQPWKMERTELSGARTNVLFFFLLNPLYTHSLWKWPLVMWFDWFLSSCLPTERLKIINSPLLRCSVPAKCWHPIHYLPGAGPFRWAFPSLPGVIEPILTSLLPLHALAKLQRDTILHMMIHSVKLL